MIVDPIASARAHIQVAETTARRSVVPLYEPGKRGEAKLVGSSVLIEVPTPGTGEPVCFLVTAAHVSDVIRPGDVHVSGANGGELIIMSDVVVGEVTSVVPPGRDRDADRYDIAFMQVDASRLNRFYRPTSLVRVVVDEREDPFDTYVAQGYPGTKNKHPSAGAPLRARPYALKLRPGGKDEVGETDHDPAFHLGLSYTPKKAFDLADWSVGRAPKLDGMSGGPIWGLLPEVSLGEAEFELVGIATETYPKRGVVMGTRIDTVVEAIRHRRPDLAPALPRVRLVDIKIQLA